MFPLAFVGGPYDIAIIALVIVVLFGGAKVPQLMKGLGEGVREFKKASSEETPARPAEAKKEEDK